MKFTPERSAALAQEHGGRLVICGEGTVSTTQKQLAAMLNAAVEPLQVALASAEKSLNELRIALAQHGEPEKHEFRIGNGPWVDAQAKDLEEIKSRGFEVRALYTHPATGHTALLQWAADRLQAMHNMLCLRAEEIGLGGTRIEPPEIAAIRAALGEKE